MSIGIAEPPKKPKNKPKKENDLNKRRTSSLREYILTCPNQMDVTFFDDQDDAYRIGNQLKELAAKEEGAKDIWSLKEFSVEIGWKTVRIRFKQEDKPAKPEYQDEPKPSCRGQ